MSGGQSTGGVFKKIRYKINRAKEKDADSKSSIDFSGPFTKEDLWMAQPRFREVTPEERPALLIKHLRMCSIIFDFNNESSKENLGKEMKKQLLLAIVDHITTSKQWFSDTVCKEILQMVGNNLFRDLPPCPSDFDPEEDDPCLDPQWPHLQLVYEFLLRFTVSTGTDTKIIKKNIDKNFLKNLIGLFRSEDPRERDYLKTVVHRTYGKFMSFRAFLRQEIKEVFYDVVYEDDKHSGISELLEICGSIINGYAVPLKNEHKEFLHDVLMPLHKVKDLNQFHQQLAYCITQFIEKDNSLAPVIIQKLLNYWPIQSSTKELLFLNELDELLELTLTTQVTEIADNLFAQISRSIRSPHFQVAERTLFLWNNDIVASYTNDNRDHILPILFPALAENSKYHWNTTVHTLTQNVKRMFQDNDPELFKKVLGQYDAEQSSSFDSDTKGNSFEKAVNAEEDVDFWASLATSVS